MELECDHTKFFQQYSGTSTLLDERFVDLVLLSDKIGKLELQNAYQLNFLEVARELELYTKNDSMYKSAIAYSLA